LQPTRLVTGNRGNSHVVLREKPPKIDSNIQNQANLQELAMTAREEIQVNKLVNNVYDYLAKVQDSISELEQQGNPDYDIFSRDNIESEQFRKAKTLIFANWRAVYDVQ
jgi:hypothetical protein